LKWSVELLLRLVLRDREKAEEGGRGGAAFSAWWFSLDGLDVDLGQAIYGDLVPASYCGPFHRLFRR